MTRLIGCIIGVLIAAAIVGSTGGDRAHRHIPPGPIISECDGALREIVIQYVGGFEPVVPVYREFLSHLDREVVVHVMCPDRVAFDELADRIDAVFCKLNPVITDHEMTAWSRDRWVALGSNKIELLAPRGELSAETWPARRGDGQVAFDLARSLDDRSITARRSDLYFDAGDFLADGSRVFVTPAVLRRNLQRTVESREELVSTLRRELGRDVVLLDDAPDHHAGMFMMSAGDNVILVGDPSLASNLAHPEIPDGADWSMATRRQFDSVAAQLTSLGYQVVRIPTVVGRDTKTYLTYVNVILDGRIVYLPQYRGANALNDLATHTWRSLGFEVRPVDCTSTYRLFGSLHCLVNVLRRR